jgi:Ca-activated chloride channel family protein
MLWLFLAVPALIGIYALLQWRKKKGALRYASLSLVREAMGPGQRFRRHVPPLLFLLAMVVSIFAIARPSAVVTLPSDRRTIILAIDVSLSMRAGDVKPSRIAAAQAAAKAFIEEQPPDVRIGIVAFAGTASVVQQPTENRDDLMAAIDRLQLQYHTAIGSGLLVSLATLFLEESAELEAMISEAESWTQGPRGVPIDRPRKAQKRPFRAVAPGSYASAAIILLSDGRATTGPDPRTAAKAAADRGVRVFTVGFGTEEGAAAEFGRWAIYIRLDEETLQAIAEITGGEYFYAGTAEDLKKVYEGLNAQYVLEKKETEITALAAAAAAVLAIAAGALSLRWASRIG